jgi:hypothetical protein
MRKSNLIWAAFGILLVGGIKLGLAFNDGTEIQPDRAEAWKRSVHMEDWQYPGSKELASGFAGSAWYVRWSSSDDLEKVIAFYEKKVPAKLTPDKPGGSTITKKDRRLFCLQDDSVEPSDSKANKNSPRPVTIRILVLNEPWNKLSLVISRAKEERHTHIALTNFTWDQF